MRLSEFDELAQHVFGASLAATYRRDLLLEDIGGLTADQAIAAGHRVRPVWVALCDAMDVPEADRWELRDVRAGSPRP